jgi:Tol biopolymer transport system component
MENLVRWTPDGVSILYATTVNGKTRIMRIPAGGGTPEFEGVEVDGPLYNLDPSPDGTRLAYSARALPTATLWAVDNIMAAVAH